METDGQVGTGTMEIPKELEAAIQAKVAEIVAGILDDKLGKRKRKHYRSSSRSMSRSKSRSRSKSKNRCGRSRSRSHGKNKNKHEGRGRHDRSRSRGRHDRSRSRGKKLCIGWEGFGPFPSHHHFHHHHAPHHSWFGGEFGPGGRRGKWGKHGKYPFERTCECKCGSGAEEKKDEGKNDEGKNKEGTPAAERNLRCDLEYLDLDDGVAEIN